MNVSGKVGRARSVLEAIAREFKEENISFMAGSIAYSAFVSLFPLLLLALLVATVVGGEAFAETVLDMTQQYLTPAAQGLVADAITQASGQVGFSVLGIAVLLWSVLKVFRGIDVAFSSLYHSAEQKGIISQVQNALIVLVAIGVAVGAMIGVSALITLVPNLPFVNSLSLIFLVLALTVAFFPIYYVFPDVDVSVTDVLPGTIVAAIGWTLLQALFQVYVQFTATNELYGAIGGIILLVTWLYFGSLVLLVGAAVNVVLSGRSETPSSPQGTDGTPAPE